MTRVLGAVWLVVAVAGCGRDGAPGLDTSAPSLTVRVFDDEGLPTRQLGEAVGRGGRSECISGVLVHASAHPARGWLCSQRCDSSADCPGTWSCGEVHPSLRLCVAPQSWQPRAAAAQRFEVAQ